MVLSEETEACVDLWHVLLSAVVGTWWIFLIRNADEQPSVGGIPMKCVKQVSRVMLSPKTSSCTPANIPSFLEA